MDRLIVQPGAIPLDTDLLSTNRNTLLALSALAMATVGAESAPLCDGLTVTQTTVPSMAVSVAPGTIFQMTTLDTTTYGSLPISSAPCLKIGNNANATTLSLSGLTGGIAAGQSQAFLIQAAFLEQDVNPVVLQYFNASNPTQPFSGPSNSGATNFTLRQETVQLEIVPGAVATSGAQVPPAVSAGWLPIAVVTVPYGTTTIQAGNIAMFPNSFVGTKLGQLRTKLTGNLTLYVSSAANASDSNSGLTQDVPFATPQGAWNALIGTYDLNNYSATIQISSGTFTTSTGLVCAGIPLGYGANSNIVINGSGSGTILGATGSHSSAVSAQNGATITVQNLSVTATGTVGAGLNAQSGSTIIDNGGIYYGSCVLAHRFSNGGFVLVSGTSTINGSAATHMEAIYGGQIIFSSSHNTNGTGAQNFPSGFAVANQGLINTQASTWTGCGAFTGPQYNASFGGSVQVVGVTLPGSTAGTVNSGTAYQGFYG